MEEKSIYELLNVPKEELETHVTCLICGKDFKSLNRHLPIHDISIDEYREEYNGPTCSEATRVHLSLKDRGKDFQYMNFMEARNYVRNLKLEGLSHWRQFCQTKDLPIRIPLHPHIIYRDKGWLSWGDWLGTNRVSNVIKNQLMLPFKEARKIARSLNLKSYGEWHDWFHENNPEGIPYSPRCTYKNEGWISIGDWLGTNIKSTQEKSKTFLSFRDAREIARSLGLNSRKQWVEWIRGNKPDQLPSLPNKTYKYKGWVSWQDWLGFKPFSYKSFEDAREYVHNLGLLNHQQWKKFASSGKRPKSLPSNPRHYYRDKGWISWYDWLGTEEETFISYEEAKKFINSLKLKNTIAWRKYASSGERPKNIPSTPQYYYKNEWISWADWLGH